MNRSFILSLILCSSLASANQNLYISGGVSTEQNMIKGTNLRTQYGNILGDSKSSFEQTNAYIGAVAKINDWLELGINLYNESSSYEDLGMYIPIGRYNTPQAPGLSIKSSMVMLPSYNFFVQYYYKGLYGGLIAKHLAFSQKILFDSFYNIPNFTSFVINFKPEEQWAKGVKVGYVYPLNERIDAVIDVQRLFLPAEFTEHYQNEEAGRLLFDETALIPMLGEKIEVSSIDIKIGIKYRII